MAYTQAGTLCTSDNVNDIEIPNKNMKCDAFKILNSSWSAKCPGDILKKGV